MCLITFTFCFYNIKQPCNCGKLSKSFRNNLTWNDRHSIFISSCEGMTRELGTKRGCKRYFIASLFRIILSGILPQEELNRIVQYQYPQMISVCKQVEKIPEYLLGSLKLKYLIVVITSGCLVLKWILLCGLLHRQVSTFILFYSWHSDILKDCL